MTVETVQIGRLTLHEDFPGQVTTDSAGGVALSGIEYADTLTAADIQRLAEDTRGLTGSLVPVVFSNRPEAAFYGRVASADVVGTRYGTQADVVTWKVALLRGGTDGEVDIEAGLSGPQTRATDHALTGERWHAPPAAAYSYQAGDSLLSTVSRTSADGAVTVRRGVPVGVSPRFGCTPANYQGARARLTSGGLERTGIRLTPDPMTWQLSNALIRVGPSAGTGRLVVEHYDGAWRTKTWELTHTAGTAFPVPTRVTVLRNDFHEAAVRVLYELPIGRALVDLTVRRGSRFVEVYVQSQTSTTLGAVLTSAAAGTSGTGYVRETSNDANGHRAVVGSARTFTFTGPTAISKAAVTAWDLFLGAEIGGSAAVSGDTATNLTAQYLGTPGELPSTIRR